MSANNLLKLLLLLLLFTCFIQLSMGARKLGELVQDQTQLMHYHNGPLLTGKISVNLIWYGKFKPSQRAIISDFVASLSSAAEPESQNQPSVAAWWKQIDRYYRISGSKKGSTAPPLSLSLGTQVLDESYSLGKSLADRELATLASRGQQRDAINVVLTASDVSVDRFCTSRCGSHGSAAGTVRAMRGHSKFAYVWVGDSAAQCPGQCAWPFHQPIYGPQSPPLVSPNDDVGLDGMVINLAALLAGTATNPFKTGFFQGPRDAPLEVASACAGVYAKGAYPGYAGDLLVEPTTGASYNANGVNGRKYLLPALYDLATSSCSTLL